MRREIAGVDDLQLYRELVDTVPTSSTIQISSHQPLEFNNVWVRHLFHPLPIGLIVDIVRCSSLILATRFL
jgi:hypothetical protein